MTPPNSRYSDPEARKEYMRDYMKTWGSTPERKRAKYSQYLKRTYGITVDRYEEMLTEQDGGCFLCGKTHPERRLHVDHCHDTGKVRGLLCSNCNSGLHTVEKMGIDSVAAYLARGDQRI